jgi:hypothetical protein
VFENRALLLKLRDRTVLTANFFEDHFWSENKKKIMKLTVQDFFLNKDSLKTWAEFKNSTDIDLSRETYNSMKVIATNAKLKLCKKEIKEKTTVDLITYLSRKVKGCKRYRKKIIGSNPVFIPHNIVKYASNTETVIDFEGSKKLNAVWNNSYFSSNMRVFLFKLHNNTAGYNNAVAHFIRGHSPNCTFCDISGNPEVEDETPLHLFYTCNISELFVENIFSWILGEAANVSRQEFFVTFNRADHRKNDALFLISMLVKKYLWDCKQRFSLPILENAKVFIREEVKIMQFCSKKAQKVFLNANFACLQG